MSHVQDTVDWWRAEMLLLMKNVPLRPFRTLRTADAFDARGINLAGNPIEHEAERLRNGRYVIFHAPHLRLQAATMRLPFSRSMEIARATVQEKTPFALADIYVLPAPDKNNEPQSSFYVIKRERVDPYLAEIARRRPRIGRLGVRDGDQVVWLPSRALERLHSAFHYLRHWRNGLLAAFAIVIIAGGATYAHVLFTYSSAQEELTELVEARRSEAMQVRKLLDRQQKSIAAVEAARKGKAQSVPVVQVWEELTRILPDDAWVTDIAIDGDMLTITGFAAESAAALIATLDASELFSAPNFTSPVVRIPGQSGERFEIRLRVQPA